MPRAARSEEEVEAFKRSILDEALEVLYQDGFANMSMRKIAARVGMTATNLYYYFSGRDEIYLEIQRRGFAKLHEKFLEIVKGDSPPEQKVRLLCWAYLDFGTGNPDLYEVMFTRDTPKYVDYVDTELEPVAEREKQTALLVLEDAIKVYNELAEKFPGVLDLDPFQSALILWTHLHGIVSLTNSRVLQEVEEDVAGFFRRAVDHLMEPLESRLKAD